MNPKIILLGATIGVQLGTTGDLDASDYEKDGSTVERYSKGSEAVQALKAGQIDCVIIDSQPGSEIVENNDDIKILDEPFEEEEYAICLKKGNDELLDKINGALKELKRMELSTASWTITLVRMPVRLHMNHRKMLTVPMELW